MMAKQGGIMRFTIKGITERTITFNSLKLTIRGDCNKFSQYPHSVAKGIEISTEDQWNEINAIVKAGFVVVEQETPPAPVKRVETQKAKSKTSKTPKVKKVKKVSKPAEAKIEQKQTEVTEEPQTKVYVPDAIQNDKIGPKMGGYLPKALTEAPKATPKVARKVAKVAEDDRSDVVMMSPDGNAIRGKMSKTSDYDAPDSEVTRASLEAAQQIEDEAAEAEARNAIPVDESALDMSERMGNDVVVSGEKGTSKTKIGRSALPPVKTDWINLEDSLNGQPDPADNAFIDKDKPDDKSDAFIE